MWEYNYHPDNILYHSLKSSIEEAKANTRYQLELFNAFLTKVKEIEEMEARRESIPSAGRSSIDRTITAKKKSLKDWQKANKCEYFTLFYKKGSMLK